MKKDEQDYEAICGRIRDAAERAGISQIRLSREAKVAHRLVWNIMRGKAKPRVTTVAKLGMVLNIPLEELLGRDPPPASVYQITGKPMQVVREDRPKSLTELIAEIARVSGIPKEKIAEVIAGLLGGGRT